MGTKVRTRTLAGLAACGLLAVQASASVLFDFDNAPLMSPLPVTLTIDGITATFTGTGQGYSIQNANVLGFTPQGFAGRCIYPSSVYGADLIVTTQQTLKDFSIMYSPEEYGCDSSATLKATAYLNGSYVGENTTTAPNPGTWPTGVLTFSSATPFNSVVVHYQSGPPTGGDWGPVFMADNMYLTAVPEPASLAGLGFGLVAAGFLRRRRR
jgi:hypothetical protein